MAFLRIAALLGLGILAGCRQGYDDRQPQLPHGGRPLVHAAFPAIADWSSLRMRLSRTPCYGSCPAYSVEIHGDGTVIYDGQMFVAVTGRHAGHIAPAKVRALFAAFRAADFFWLHDAYRTQVTDNPTQTLSLAYDGHAKTVEDYAGVRIGMPRAVAELEDTVDRLAGTDVWIRGDEPTFAKLRAEGWDFHNTDDQHRYLILSAAQSGNRALVGALLAAGVPGDGSAGCHALAEAARRGDADMMQLLLAAGAPMTAPKMHLPDGRTDPIHPFDCDVLSDAAMSGVPAVVALALSRHPDVNHAEPVAGRTALLFLAGSVPWQLRPGQDFEKSAALLIAAGADVNARDSDGRTPLIEADDREGLVRVLLRAGAEVDAADASGDTALMKTYVPGVAQVLLEAGADPWRKNDSGETALDNVLRFEAHDTYRVIEVWMALHPRPPARHTRP